MPTPKYHVNLYLDPAARGQLRDLCQQLELQHPQLIYRLIGIAHKKMQAALRAKPLPPSHRLILNSKFEFEQSGPAPITRHEARRRVRYFHGAYLLDEFTANQLSAMVQRSGKPAHQLLGDLVDWAAGQAGMNTWDSGHNPRPAAEPDESENSDGSV